LTLTTQLSRRYAAPPLRTKAEILAYLSAVIEAEDPKLLIAVLGNIAVAVRRLPPKAADALQHRRAPSIAPF
jgi:DNA-binding phage protein